MGARFILLCTQELLTLVHDVQAIALFARRSCYDVFVIDW
jgi:hypothetical protein